jgi:hypothetical protein
MYDQHVCCRSRQSSPVMSAHNTESLVRRVIHQAHRDRQLLSVIRKAGPSLQGPVTAVDVRGFHIETAQGASRVWWGDVWSVFRVQPVA